MLLKERQLRSPWWSLSRWFCTNGGKCCYTTRGDQTASWSEGSRIGLFQGLFSGEGGWGKMKLSNCFVFFWRSFRISNLVLSRVWRRETAVLLNGVKKRKSLFNFSVKFWEETNIWKSRCHLHHYCKTMPDKHQDFVVCKKEGGVILLLDSDYRRK